MASKAGESRLAARYALALFELADDQKKLDVVADDLRAFDAAAAESEDLHHLIHSPVLSRREQGAAIAAILETSGADELTRNFVGIVAANRRLFRLHDMIDAYLAELARRRGEITAEVTSARTLNKQQTKTVEEALRQVVGGKVALSLEVDPSLIGGLVVKIGSRMVDSSLKTQLDKMKLVMKGAG